MSDTEQHEVWKTYQKIPFIQASSLGRIRTVDRYVQVKGQGKRLIQGRVLKQELRKDGYMYVKVSVNYKTINLSVHRVVATCFLPNPNNYSQVNHIDNDRTNNVVSNLEWCSREYNEAYKKNFGTSSAQLFGRPVIAINRETSEVFYFETQAKAARQLGISDKHIGTVSKGLRRTAYGYCFTYADEKAVENTRSKFGDEIAEKVKKLMSEHRN